MKRVLQIDDKYRIEQDNFNFIVVTTTQRVNKKGETVTDESKRFLPTLYSALSEVVELRAADQDGIDAIQESITKTSELLQETREIIKDTFKTI